MVTKFDYKIVFRVLSNLLFISTIALLISALVAIYFKEHTNCFFHASAIAFILGVILYIFSGTRSTDLVVNQKEAYLVVTLSWLLLGLIGMLPYLFSSSIPDPVNAFFESVSGFTTTGSSILTDIESLPKSILFWRSLTHWIGGIGIIVLVIVVMPTLQAGGYNLFTLESSLQEKIQPRIRTVGYRLLLIYIGLTAFETMFLLFGGMNFFDSVCHAFGTVATGGFSTKNTSIADYSPYIQYIITLFMLLAGTNFVIHYFILKRNFTKIRNNEEVRFYLIITSVITLLVALPLLIHKQYKFEEAFRHSLFQTVSILTCTGFATADYLQWPVTSWIIILFAMFLGGSAGSTAGGVKMVRHLILLKNIKRVFIQVKSPNAIIPIRLNRQAISEDANNSVLTFIVVYFLVFITATILLLAIGLDGETSVSSVATCMAGIGPGIGTVGPASNFAHLPDVSKLILSLVMIMGRLEIYTVILLFSRDFWRN